MQFTEQSRRAGRVLLMVIGCLLAAVLVFSILGAVSGESALGWQSYRYSGEGYTVGEGTVPHANITRIELDWLDGAVEIVACDDTFVSLTESADTPLAEAMKVRWRVDENGTLSIKYRKSTWFVGFGMGQANKKLTLRIPKSMFASIETLAVEATSADVAVSDLSLSHLSAVLGAGNLKLERCAFAACKLNATRGEVTLLSCSVKHFSAALESGDLMLDVSQCPEEVEIEMGRGDAELGLPADADFTLSYQTKSGDLISDFSLQKQGELHLCGKGGASFLVKTASGDLILTQNNDLE